MRVAFFVNGPDEHGVVRASRILAEALGRLDGCSVSIVRSMDPTVDPATADGFRQRLNQADVVVVHASSRTNDLWGAPKDRADAIAAFCSGIRKPVIMYLHDVYGETPLGAVVGSARRVVGSIGDFHRLRANGSKFLRTLGRQSQSVESRFVRRVDECVAGFLVSNDVERERMQRHRPRRAIGVVPHFIEQRSSLIDKADAKKQLGMSDRPVVTLLGFIVRRKGHEIALSMLRSLPRETLMVFAGAPNDENDAYYRRLMETVETAGLQDRVRVTGYLDEKSLDVHLSATDVAVCPFQEVSASGSFATWLAAAKPIVASDLPLFRAYRAEFGEGIMLAPAGNASAFAALVKKAMADSDRYAAEIRSAAERYSVEATARRMLTCLREMA